MSDADTTEVTDRVERSIVINAPRERVWLALSNAEAFGTWFGANLKGQTFVPGQRTCGPITIEGLEHVAFDVIVERMEAPKLMTYRWHPYAIEEGVDYEQEERTLVTFTLIDLPDGATKLTVVESGFDKVPPHRRMSAFRANSNGWVWQLGRLGAYAESVVTR